MDRPRSSNCNLKTGGKASFGAGLGSWLLVLLERLGSICFGCVEPSRRPITESGVGGGMEGQWDGGWGCPGEEEEGD